MFPASKPWCSDDLQVPAVQNAFKFDKWELWIVLLVRCAQLWKKNKIKVYSIYIFSLAISIKNIIFLIHSLSAQTPTVNIRFKNTALQEQKRPLCFASRQSRPLTGAGFTERGWRLNYGLLFKLKWDIARNMGAIYSVMLAGLKPWETSKFYRKRLL